MEAARKQRKQRQNIEKTVESSSNALAKWWNRHKNLFHYPYNSQAFFDEWEYTHGELTTAAFLRAFNFGYIEFGRYVNQKEREERFTGLVEGCMLLSSELFFDSSNLGCERLINIAIGARGSGGKAAATFEPAHCVINVTKNGGNHSFAHEYAHALDFVFGRYYDQHPIYNYASGQYDFQGVAQGKNQGGRIRQVLTAIVLEAANQMPLIFEKDNKGKYIHNEYWRRPTEIFARSFEAWVSWVFSTMSGKVAFKLQNSFLVRDWSYYNDSPVYPHKFEKLDDLFIVFCKIAGDAMNGISLNKLPSLRNANAVKKMQAVRRKCGTGARKRTAAKPKTSVKRKPASTAKKKTTVKRAKR